MRLAKRIASAPVWTSERGQTMSYFTTKNGDQIFLNLDPMDRQSDDTTKFSRKGTDALKLIKSTANTKQLTEVHFAAVDVVYDEGICISPYTIFKLPLHRDICRLFNEISVLGCELREELDGVGAFAFLDGVHDRKQSQGIIERILAVFTVSIDGLTKISDVPLDLVHAVVDLFRTTDGLGWNSEILGVGDVIPQCISNVVNGLAKIFNDDTLVHKARKHRSASAGKENSSWFAFQHSTDILDQELLAFFRSFREDSRMRPDVAQATILKIASWMKETFPNEKVRDVVLSAAQAESLTAFLTRKNGGNSDRTILATVEAARKFSVSISEQLAGSVDGRVMYDLVPQKQVNKLKNEIKKQPKPSRTRSRPLPEKLIPIMKEILEEGAEGWPGRNFRADVITNGNVQNVYCPVIPSLFSAMLDVPLRMGQIRRLDSGEGDVRHFNGDKMEWQKNNGPLAGYWADFAGKSRKSFATRGYAIEIEDEIKPVTGIWVNTNKTGQPFAIPWYIPSLLNTLWNLRKWQEKFNPIVAPLSPENYLDAPHHYSDASKAEMPHIFPLSRMLPSNYKPMQGRVLTSSEIDHAWCALLFEIQLRWNKHHPGNQVTLVDISPNGQPFHPRYNIHGLRVRGLTNLRRGGMPLDLLSKFVAGHATLLMTLYYTEPHPSEIADQLERAAARFEAQREFIDDLKRMEVDEALKRTVSVSKSAVPEAINSGSQFQFCNVAIGVCPYDGSRCSDGGTLLRKEGKDDASKNIYGPVESRNCVMCRHFISGPPWLNELEAYGTKLCERRQYLAVEENRFNEVASQYEQAHRDGTIESAEFENRWEELGADMQQVKNEQEMVENATFNVELLCNASVKLLDGDPTGEAGLMLVANNRSSVIEYREVSEFEQAVRITAAGRIHRILGDERVERKRDDYLNLMLFNSGLTSPQMITRVSHENRRRAMDQYALFVSSRASSEDIDGLVDGTVRLRDLGIEEQVRNLIDVALSEPVLLPGVARHYQPATVGVLP